MKHDKDYKIQLRYEGFHFGEYRFYWYRIAPSELSLFDRLFNNKWKILYHYRHPYFLWDFKPSMESANFLYTKDDYYNELAGLKTLSDVREYLNKQDELEDAAKKEALKKREIWPD